MRTENMLVGILKPNDKIIDTEKVFMTVAQCHGHQSFVFTAKNVDFTQQIIHGKTMLKGKLIEQTFPFPDIIQNRLPIHEQDVMAYVKLAKEIPFTTHHIETKVELYKKMKAHPLMQKYVIESQSCQSFQVLMGFINKYQYVILKPASSKQAIGICTIQLINKKFWVKELDKILTLDEFELEQLFEQKKTEYHFFVSPFFHSKTNNNLSTVFRLHMVLGEQGEWHKIKFFPYVNLKDHQDIANGIQGALISTREELFLKQYYPDFYESILKKIDILFQDTSQFMLDLYQCSIDAVGLDIGINQQGEIKIFEINAGPGVGFMAYPVAEQQILYYEWLLENTDKIGINNFLPKRYRHYYDQI